MPPRDEEMQPHSLLGRKISDHPVRRKEPSYLIHPCSWNFGLLFSAISFAMSLARPSILLLPREAIRQNNWF